jgi:hypothetical protein
LGGEKIGGLGWPAAVVTAGVKGPVTGGVIGGEAPGEELPEEEVDHWLASGPRGSVFLAAFCDKENGPVEIQPYFRGLS